MVHSWDVLHGVDVEAGLDRTSLIVWFTESNQAQQAPDSGSSKEPKENPVSPWLLRHPEQVRNNDVLQFVLASALSSASPSEKSLALSALGHGIENEIELYLESASQRNIFALTRMGSLCEEENALNKGQQERAKVILDQLRPFGQLPQTMQDMFDKTQKQQHDSHDVILEMSVRFWLEGSLGGSPLAQKALADELMLEASQSGNADLRLLAAVFFALAAQQDDESAHESLSRVLEYDLAIRGVETKEDFLASPVVQIANAAISNTDLDPPSR